MGTRDVREVVFSHEQSKWKSYLSSMKQSLQANPLSDGELCILMIQLKILCGPSAFYSVKMRYDESDNILVRASRMVTDKVEDAFSELRCRWFAPLCSYYKHSWSNHSI